MRDIKEKLLLSICDFFDTFCMIKDEIITWAII